MFGPDPIIETSKRRSTVMMVPRPILGTDSTDSTDSTDVFGTAAPILHVWTGRRSPIHEVQERT